MARIVLVTGGRDYQDRSHVRARLAKHARVGNVLVVGGADGADEESRIVWHYEFQLPYVVHPAPWDRAGRAAGPMRNLAMLDGLSLAPHAHLPPLVVEAFPGGRGTNHCVDAAIGRGIHVVHRG